MEATASGLGTETQLGFPIMLVYLLLCTTSYASLCYAVDFSRLEILWLWNKRVFFLFFTIQVGKQRLIPSQGHLSFLSDLSMAQLNQECKPLSNWILIIMLPGTK